MRFNRFLFNLIIQSFLPKQHADARTHAILNLRCFISIPQHDSKKWRETEEVVYLILCENREMLFQFGSISELLTVYREQINHDDLTNGNFLPINDKKQSKKKCRIV